MRRLVFTVMIGLAALATPAAAEERIALVIGNSAYRDNPLTNPANDARLMAATLADLGFEVIERIDADQKAMKIAIFEFGDRLEAAGKDAVGLFYYAGHGLQVGGDNYLVPLGAAIERESHVTIEAVGASWVLSVMEFAGNRMNFVILDACRNNPLTRSFRSATRGLARMNAPRGSLVAYSTGPGDVASDGDGANSPYTLALAKAMRGLGVSAEKIFKQTRDSVMAATKGAQTPWEESSLTGADFLFAGGATDAAPAAAVAPAQPAATAAQDTVFWQSIQTSDDPAMFDAYLAQFPNGTFAALARLRRDALKASQVATAEPRSTEPTATAPEPVATALLVPAPQTSDLVKRYGTPKAGQVYRYQCTGPWWKTMEMTITRVAGGIIRYESKADGVAGWAEVPISVWGLDIYPKRDENDGNGIKYHSFNNADFSGFGKLEPGATFSGDIAERHDNDR